MLAQLLATRYQFVTRVLWCIVEGKQTFTFTFFPLCLGVFFSARFETFAVTPEKKKTKLFCV